MCQKRGIPCDYDQPLTWADEVVETFAADDLIWTQLPKQPATWTNGVDPVSDEAVESLENAPKGVHFVNVSSHDISAVLHSTEKDSPYDSTETGNSPRRTDQPLPRLWQSRSAFDLMLGDHDQSSLMLLDYCNSYSHLTLHSAQY